MKHPTVVDNTQLGSFEDSRGYVGAHLLRREYAVAMKAMCRAQRAADENTNPERQPLLNTALTVAQEAFSFAQRAVSRHEG